MFPFPAPAASSKNANAALRKATHAVGVAGDRVLGLRCFSTTWMSGSRPAAAYRPTAASRPSASCFAEAPAYFLRWSPVPDPGAVAASSRARSVRCFATSSGRSASAADACTSGVLEAVPRSEADVLQPHPLPQDRDQRPPSRVSQPPRIRVHWKVGVYCPECGKKSEAGAVDEMGQFCPTMWRKYMRIDDRHCPLFLACKVKDDIVHCEHTGWKDMPRVKGRS